MYYTFRIYLFLKKSRLTRAGENDIPGAPVSDKREIVLTDGATTSSWRRRWLLTVLRSIPLAGHGAILPSLSLARREDSLQGLRASLSLSLLPSCTHSIAVDPRIPSPSTGFLLPLAFMSRSLSTLRRRMVGYGWTRSDNSPSADCGGRGVVQCLARSTSLVASSRHVTVSHRRVNEARDATPIDVNHAWCVRVVCVGRKETEREDEEEGCRSSAGTRLRFPSFGDVIVVVS